MTEINSVSDLKNKKIHFIGIGGTGMSGIARIALAHGLHVSGSDLKESVVTENLRNLGAQIFIGHDVKNQATADLVIVSGAVSHLNPEYEAASNRGAMIIARAQALAILMVGSRSVAVAGTHGKTTTTSMLTVALQFAGVDPSFAIGGMINRSGTNAHLGSGDIFVAEADESDGSFLAYKPLGAIITNIELEHVDHFPTLEEVYQLFMKFVDSVQTGGFIVMCLDDAGVRELLRRVTRSDISILTYGSDEKSPQADYLLSRLHLEKSAGLALVTHNGKVLGEMQVNIPGRHNMWNAAAALAAGDALGVLPKLLIEGLGEFTGSRRRFEVKGEIAGIRVIDDYGHHPTEVIATLETARRYAGEGNVYVVFQPHRFSRTQRFASEFAQALNLADHIYLLEVYPAGEKAIPGVSSLMISSLGEPQKFHYEPSMIKVIQELAEKVVPGDVVITLGAGDVNSIVPVLLANIGERFA